MTKRATQINCVPPTIFRALRRMVCWHSWGEWDAVLRERWVRRCPKCDARQLRWLY